MDVPFPIHVVHGGDIESLRPGEARLVLQARSLRNTLNVLKRRLRRMTHDNIHTLADVEHYKFVLDHLEQRWRDEEGTFAGKLARADASLAEACSTLWTECYDLVASMEEEALEMPEEVRRVHTALVSLHRQLQEMGEREHTSDEVASVIRKLDEIDDKRLQAGGTFGGDVEAPAPGQMVCMELMSQNYYLAKECAKTAHDQPAELMAATDTLRGLKMDLRLLAGQRHHTAEDVSHYRVLLMGIASSKAEYASEWSGSEAETLLQECLQLAQHLEDTAEQMPPKMAEVYDRLKRLKNELKGATATHGRPDESRLKAWWKEVDAVEEERAAGGGVWGGGEGGINAPPGQAVCRHLLDQCYEMLQILLERQTPGGEEGEKGVGPS